MAIRQPAPTSSPDEWSHYHGRRMSEEEFHALDDAHETDLEYYDGAAWEKGLVDRNHRQIAGEFTFRFGGYSRSAGGEQGPEGRVRLPNGRWLKPDSAYWLPGIPSGNESLPTVCVEVRSPGQSMESQRRKCRLYREAGVPISWLVDPISRVVEVFEGDHDAEPLPPDGVLASELLPGFSMSVAEIWAALDR